MIAPAVYSAARGKCFITGCLSLTAGGNNYRVKKFTAIYTAIYITDTAIYITDTAIYTAKVLINNKVDHIVQTSTPKYGLHTNRESK